MAILDETVAAYIRGLVAHEDDSLQAVRQKARELRLPSISPEAGQLLQVLLKLGEARRVLEVGTCTGYSAIWIARGLPDDGHVDTLEIDPDRKALAEAHFRQAGVDNRVTVHLGDANATLRALRSGSYDVVFIDADKEGYPAYLDHARRLVRLGGMIWADNALWQGRVAQPVAEGDGTEAIRQLNASVFADKSLLATLLPVGDGLVVAIRLR